MSNRSRRSEGNVVGQLVDTLIQRRLRGTLIEYGMIVNQCRAPIAAAELRDEQMEKVSKQKAWLTR